MFDSLLQIPVEPYVIRMIESSLDFNAKAPGAKSGTCASALCSVLCNTRTQLIAELEEFSEREISLFNFSSQCFHSNREALLRNTQSRTVQHDFSRGHVQMENSMLKSCWLLKNDLIDLVTA
jgi:hypothetical protein